MINRSGTASNPDMRSFLGRSLRGTYFLEEFLGQGGFGAVFKSTQHFLGLPVRRVAVKLSKQTGIDLTTARDIFADALLLAQAMDEMTDMEARSHLTHVYDLGVLPEAENRGFIVMEYVQGTTLRAQFTSLQQVPASLMLKWARQICHALQGLHTLPEPVLHRDLKPENILLGTDLTVRVIDFGLAAKMVDHRYVPGVVGTFLYMSPETMQGKSVPASDVYSVGTLLYEGLAGEHPFKHLIPPTGMPERFHKDWLYEQKKIVRPRPPSFLNNTLTDNLAYLNDVVLHCLEFDHHRRYQDADELLKALEPSPFPPSNDYLDEGFRLKAAGNLVDARRTFEHCLAISTLSKEKRFALLRALGEVLSMIKEHSLATDSFVEAWELIKDSAVLQTRKERAELLGQIADAYHCSLNDFQANKYERLRVRELGISER
jgi:serine/threonine protein kinase